MLSPSLILPLVLLFSSAQAAPSNGYIVELSSNASPSSVSLPPGTQITRRWTHSSFNGLSLRNVSLSLSELRSLDGVKNAWENERVAHPDAARMREMKRSGKWKSKRNVSEGAVQKKRDYVPPFGPDYEGFKNSDYFPHQLINATSLHQRGILGQGIKVAIIDSGFDYTHPVLGGCFGAGCKVSFGRDMVGDDFQADGDVPVPDDDPMDLCGILPHGTNVAGSIAANPNNDYPFFGIAPLAELGFYRVYGCGGVYSTQEVWIDALLAAVEDGADVINVSLVIGSPYFDDNPAALVADRLVREQGVIITASIGNSGSEGMFLTAAVGQAPNVWSIGGVDTSPIFSYEGKTTNGSTFGYYSYFPFNASLPLYDASNPNSSVINDACSPFPAGTDLSGVVTLVRSGGCRYGPKFSNLAAAKASYILVMADVPGTTSGLEQGLKGVGYISADVFTLLHASPNQTIDFTSLTRGAQSGSGIGLPSPGLSSWGPSLTLTGPVLNPSFLAPVDGVFTTTFGGKYQEFSGTSVASPLAAGSAALWLSARKAEGLTGLQIRSLFSSTAQLLAVSDEDSSIASAAQTGSGRLNVQRAVDNSVTFEPYTLNLNDTVNFVSNHTIKLTNFGKEERRFMVKAQSSVTAFAYAEGETRRSGETPQTTNDPLTTVSAPESVTVAAGSTVDVVVSFQKPEDHPQFPIYSGHILFVEPSQTLVVPYMGMANKQADFSW
ncbi:subtilisin-like protein [Atractiella rhizophila]|nr:subtilisin-like protein [Atractiella rhizophila]